MFYTLHRAIKFLLLCAALFVGWQIYQQRAVFEPAWIWLDVWDNGGFKAPHPEMAQGRVIRVANSQTFIMAPAKGQRLNVRLMGLRSPSQEVTVEGVERERKRKAALEELVDDRWVHVELIYKSDNNIGGIVYAGGTNINAEVILRGMSSTTRELIKGFPKHAQYSMLWAERHRPRTE